MKKKIHMDVPISNESTLKLHYSGSKSFQFNNIKSMQLERTNWINVTSWRRHGLIVHCWKKIPLKELFIELFRKGKKYNWIKNSCLLFFT